MLSTVWERAIETACNIAATRLNDETATVWVMGAMAGVRTALAGFETAAVADPGLSEAVRQQLRAVSEDECRASVGRRLHMAFEHGCLATLMEGQRPNGPLFGAFTGLIHALGRLDRALVAYWSDPDAPQAGDNPHIDPEYKARIDT